MKESLEWQDDEIQQLLVTGVVDQWLFERYAVEIAALKLEAETFLKEKQLDPQVKRGVLAEKVKYPNESLCTLIEQAVSYQNEVRKGNRLRPF